MDFLASPDKAYEYNSDRAVPPRTEMVKRLDVALAGLENAVEQVSERIAPALRPGGTVRPMREEEDKAVESDVVAHLRHTADRIAAVTSRLVDLTDCIDI